MMNFPLRNALKPQKLRDILIMIPLPHSNTSYNEVLYKKNAIYLFILDWNFQTHYQIRNKVLHWSNVLKIWIMLLQQELTWLLFYIKLNKAI